MTRTSLETEQKFAFDDDVVLPDLAGLAAGEGLEVVAGGTVELVATYYDTEDLRLLRSGVTLRRREGGGDEGWHLKVPSGRPHRRVEVQLPLCAGGVSSGGEPVVPPELLELAFARLRGAAVAPVAVLRTRRTLTELRAAGGEPLVTVADDRVVASPPGPKGVAVAVPAPGASQRWREIELEEAPGAEGLARRVAGVLAGAGGRPDDGGPKLAHALGIAAPEARGGSAAPGAATRPSAVPAGGPPAGPPAVLGRVRSAPVVAAVLDRLAQQTEALLRQDLALRSHEADAVHEMRVACRRLTSALETFRPLFARDPARALRGELKWLASALGEARDAEVMRRRLEEALSELPPEQLLGPVRATITDRLVAQQAKTRQRLVAVMRSERYGLLLDALASFVDAPPVVAGRGVDPSAGKAVRAGATATARRRVRRDLRRVRAAMRAASREAGPRRASLLHAARKAAKRSRYALETVAPALGEQSERLAGRYEVLQQALGEHHDATVIGELLREEGARAGVRAGENGYSYGLLAGIERCRAERAEQAAWAALRKADERRARRFLR